MSDGISRDDPAEMQAGFDSLAATLVSRPEEEIREALTRFWADNLDEIGEDVSDWIEDDTAGLANGEMVMFDVRRFDMMS